ncbi:MAG TPA: hypothetical protein VIG44_06610, partial [Thermomicrobiales bacterium]
MKDGPMVTAMERTAGAVRPVAINRRRFLALAGSIAGGAILAACGGSKATDTPQAAASSPTTGASAAPTTAASSAVSGSPVSVTRAAGSAAAGTTTTGTTAASTTAVS